MPYKVVPLALDLCLTPATGSMDTCQVFVIVLYSHNHLWPNGVFCTSSVIVKVPDPFHSPRRHPSSFKAARTWSLVVRTIFNTGQNDGPSVTLSDSQHQEKEATGASGEAPVPYKASNTMQLQHRVVI